MDKEQERPAAPLRDKDSAGGEDIYGKLQTGIVYSLAFDPWYNLALEEYLLNGVKETEVILYLWQNQNTVVIGRNQNAWRECRAKLLERDGGKLARRLSGGGAVYHDLGNLNFTFILPRKYYDLKKQLQVILDAVKNLGIEAEFSGRNDLLAEGRKFSGNAFYLSEGRAYHHGTILLDTDFEKLVGYLQVSREKIVAKGVESVRSRVINLKELVPGLTIKAIQDSLERSFLALYGGSGLKQELDPAALPDLAPLYRKYSSWEWRYGQTPEFDITFEQRFDWGGVELKLKLKKGTIEQAVIYSDAMAADLIREIAAALRGVPYKKDCILDKISLSGRLQKETAITDEIIGWLKTREI